MKKFAFILLGVSFFLFLTSLLAVSFSNRVISEETFYTEVNVTSNVAGFDLNASALTFGKLNIGGSTTRSINLDNSFDFPVYAYIDVEGDISELISYEPRIFIDRNSSVKIPFLISAPPGTGEGTYTGLIDVRIRLK